MRASSIFNFFVLTFVLIFFAEASTQTSLEKRKVEPTTEELDNQVDSVHLDSLSISEINSKTDNYYSESQYIAQSKSRNKIIFFPIFGLYTGPTATQNSTTTILLGTYFNNLVEEFESIRIGTTLTTTLDLFFNSNYQMALAPQTWGMPYWNMNLNFSVDPKNVLSSFMNVRNISIGVAYGVNFKSKWSLESYISLLNLKGTAIGVNTIYTFSL